MKENSNFFPTIRLFLLAAAFASPSWTQNTANSRKTPTFYKDTQILAQLFRNTSLPSVQEFTQQEEQWIIGAIAEVTAFANSPDNPSSRLRDFFNNPALPPYTYPIGIFKGNPEEFFKLMPNYYPGVSQSLCLTFAKQFRTGGKTNYVLMVISPEALTSRLQVVEAMNHELAGHVANEGPGAGNYPVRQLENQAFRSSIKSLLWLVHHPEVASFTPEEQRELRQFYIVREQQWLTTWGGTPER